MNKSNAEVRALAQQYINEAIHLLVFLGDSSLSGGLLSAEGDRQGEDENETSGCAHMVRVRR
jgi:hypothetical protein